MLPRGHGAHLTRRFRFPACGRGPCDAGQAGRRQQAALPGWRAGLRAGGVARCDLDGSDGASACFTKKSSLLLVWSPWGHVLLLDVKRGGRCDNHPTDRARSGAPSREAEGSRRRTKGA